RASTSARASAEWLPRTDVRSPQRASPPEGESTARRQIQPFELIDSVVNSIPMRSAPPPAPALQRPRRSLSHSSPGRSSASSSAAPAGQRETPPSR
ncbi:MAG: hypothetical protein ACREUT_04530, partial [Steroidobacteraceae bacterium]